MVTDENTISLELALLIPIFLGSLESLKTCSPFPTACESKYIFVSTNTFMYIQWSHPLISAYPVWRSPSKNRASQAGLVVKNPPANAGDIRDAGWISGTGRSPGGGPGNPPQYSCLENPMDRGAQWATAHWVAREMDMTKET